MATITDTAVVTSTLRRARLGDLTVRIPRSPTIQYMFWMNDFLARFEANEVTTDDFTDLFDQTVELLERYNEKLDVARLKATCELADLVTFYQRKFLTVGDDDDEGDERPPRARRGTTGATKPTRSRSRS